MGQTEESTKGRINEPTISFTSFDDFGFIYKLEQKNNWYWRFLLLYGRQYARETVGAEFYHSSSYFAPGLGLGIEKRFSIVRKLQFKTGADVRFSYGEQEQSTNDDLEDHYYSYERSYVSYKLNAILGLNYLINEHFIVSVEFTPYILYGRQKTSYVYSQEEEQMEELDSRDIDQEYLSYSLTNKTVSIALAYRFWKTRNK